MAYFTQGFIDFFTGLEANNSKEWFDQNRKVYEKEVKQPFRRLVEAMLDKASHLDPGINMAPKDAIFRINRDIRFSKDKTPYNTVVKAGFSRDGRKSPYPGYVFGINAREVYVGGGVFFLEKERLKQVRDHIALHTAEFLSLVKRKEFLDTYGYVRGDAIKRIPSEYKEAFARTPLIANKTFYYMKGYKDPARILSDDLAEFLFEHWKVIQPVNDFFKAAID